MNDYDIVGLFCEDIREEINQKHSLIGVYNDGVRVTTVPGAFSKLGVYVRGQFKPSFEVKELQLILRTADGSDINLGEFDLVDYQGAKAKLEPTSPYIGLVMQAILSPLPIKVEGRIFAIVRVNGVEHIASTLIVRARRPNESSKASPTASEPPASQSPPAAPST